MVALRFSGGIVVISGDVMNPIFGITLMIFVKGLPGYFFDGLESITTGIN